MSGARWTEEDLAKLAGRNKAVRVVLADAVKEAHKKYRNQITYAEDIRFDSKREASYWLELRMREKAGDLRHLQRQVKFPLTCQAADGTAPVVAHYVADYVYEDATGTHVVDAKGKRTQMYTLKRKWLELQTGIVIEEV